MDVIRVWLRPMPQQVTQMSLLHNIWHDTPFLAQPYQQRKVPQQHWQNNCVNDNGNVIVTEPTPLDEGGRINDEQPLEMEGKKITVVFMGVCQWMLPMPWTFPPLLPLLHHLVDREHHGKRGGHVQRGVTMNNVRVIVIIGIE